MKIHLHKKQLSPDAAAGGDSKKPAPKQLAADLDFLKVAKAVSAKWTATPTLTVIYKTEAQFKTDVENYETSLTGRKAAGSFRPSQTSTLATYDVTIDDAVNWVKGYIEKKFKKNAVPQYARYGIVKEGKNYRLPRDRDDRVPAFPLMITAIAADGFGAEEFGTTFWTNMKSDYSKTLTEANATDSTVSGGVSDKNILKKGIQGVFTSLRFIIRGNYPETYAAVYRQFGWQKEDY